MQIFLDTANLDDIVARLEHLDGVTTNPTLVARESSDMEGHIRSIVERIGEKPIMAEVTGETTEAMVDEGRRLAGLGPSMLVKIPATMTGLSAVRALRSENIDVTVTLVFSPMQALLAARAGATVAALFIGRLDDVGADGAETLALAKDALEAQTMDMQLCAASIRTVEHATACALAGADILTMPPAVFDALMHHPLTDAGLARFLADWKKAKAASA